MQKGILIGGTGGQGIVAAGEFLSEALFRAGYQVINSRSYGAEARGGSCKSEVIVSDHDIYDIALEKADILIILSAPAMRRFQGVANKNALVFVDDDVFGRLGEEEIRPDVEFVLIPASKMAEELGNQIVANMVLLGALSKRSDIISREKLEDAVRAMMRPSMQAINLRALEAGHDRA